MKVLSKMAVTAATAAIAAGGGATVASAYSISGGAYTGVTTVDHTFAIAAAYAYSCPAALTTFSGTATGAGATTFTPTYGGPNDCNFYGMPVTVTQSGTWSLRVVAGPIGGWYTGELQIPSGTSTAVDWPLSGCLFTVSGTQTFQDGVNGDVIRMRNTSTGVELEAVANNIAYTVAPGASCPFASNNDGTYNTNGAVTIPGITIS